MKILKYVLSEVCSFELPVNSEVLTVASQGENVCMWVRVSECEITEARKFRVVMTGGSVNSDLKYLGTAFLGSLVLHVFEDGV